MKYLRFCTAVICSVGSCLIWGLDPLAVLSYFVLTILVGEYLFPSLIHRSDENFDLNQRWSEASSGLKLSEESNELDRFPKSVRIFVMDDDSPIMTWIGWRTIIMGRGCYNLDHTQFLCAMQEAVEQRINLRSFVFLFATMGNLPYLAMRLFCRFGYLVSWMLGISLGMVFCAFTDGGFGKCIHAGKAATTVTNAIYNAISWMFLRISNLSVYVPYWFLLIWGDHDVDRVMSLKGFQMPLRFLIDAIHQTSYHSPFLRERPLVLRAPRPIRINWLTGQTNTTDHYNGSLQHIRPQVKSLQQSRAPNGWRTKNEQQLQHSNEVRRIQIVTHDPAVQTNSQRKEFRRIRIIEHNDHR